MEDWMQDILTNHSKEAFDRANELLAAARLCPDTGCLLTSTTGPQKVRFLGRQMEVYRFVYCLSRGVALPFRIVVRHRCANRTCINPAHLEEGDRRDNKHDDWVHAAYGISPALLPRG